MEELDHIFKHVQRVETPPYLYTKVQARIAALKEEKISWIQAIIASAALASVLLFSIRVIKNDRKSTSEQGQILTETSNQLY
ncbi:MAG: hypothetical protein ACOVO3_07110 [Fluviicola sp.]